MMWSGSKRVGRLVLWLDTSKSGRSWRGPKTNSPYYWLLTFGPFAIGWLRKDWNNPIVLPRQARRALLRGKSVHVAGYEHLRRKVQ